MGSCTACSQDQQWEKRWNMLCSPAPRGGLSLAPAERAARCGFVPLPAATRTFWHLRGVIQPLTCLLSCPAPARISSA